MSLEIRVVEEMSNTYVVLSDGEAMIVDAGVCVDKIMEAVGDALITHIVLTHAHIDHMAYVNELAKKVGIAPELHEDERVIADNPQASGSDEGYGSIVVNDPREFLLDGDEIHVGQATFIVLCTPGHTPGSICLYDELDGVLLSGDTLFKNGVGRTDFQGGNAEDMKNSLKRLFQLPGLIEVLPGHGGITSIGKER